MSSSKFTLSIFGVILAMTTIAYLTLEVPYSTNGAVETNYTADYLLGFTLPLIGAGTFLATSVYFVLRTRKVRMRKSL